MQVGQRRQARPHREESKSRRQRLRHHDQPPAGVTVGETGGDNGVLSVWPPPWLKSPIRYYYWALVFAGAGVALLRLVAASPFGLALRAARDHARRAEAVGIDIRALQWTAFVVAGFFAGLAKIF